MTGREGTISLESERVRVSCLRSSCDDLSVLLECCLRNPLSDKRRERLLLLLLERFVPSSNGLDLTLPGFDLKLNMAVKSDSIGLVKAR